ncbi:MAG: type II toxin-antitoxin system VapC family toxin [Chloroflexota bacterium]|nr:type II toxin-antitoxin system VapC family toxin [Chloroflexota bacterium]
MATYFFDSSAIVKYYLTEPGSVWVRQIVNDKNNFCVICEISLAEVAAALAQARRAKRLGHTAMRNIYALFRADLRSRLFYTYPIILETAELAANIAMRQPLKGCDALQVAAALLIEDPLQVAVIFMSSDQQALRAAALEGLQFADPMDHTDEDKPQ